MRRTATRMIHLDEHGTWATIPEAAHRYGVQPVTIYAWTYRKNIRTERIVPDGRDDMRPIVHVRIDDIAAYLRARDHAVESGQALPELCP